MLPVSFLNARARPKSLTRVDLGVKAVLCGKCYLRRKELGREQSNLCRSTDRTVHRRFDGDCRNGRMGHLREKTIDILDFGLCPCIDRIGYRRGLVQRESKSHNSKVSVLNGMQVVCGWRR